MNINLHANARTTPAERAEIQASTEPVRVLARRYGVSKTTVYKWRNAGRVLDGSHCRHNLGQSTTPAHEQLIAGMRTDVRLSLDNIVESLNRSNLARQFSRSAVHRCLKRLGLNRPPTEKVAREVGQFENAPCGFIHIDLKILTPLRGRRSVVFVAIDRATRFVFARVVTRRDQHTMRRCLEAFLAEFKPPVHTILTDNGGEFTDRFARKKNKPMGTPSGHHAFDAACRKHGIEHRLIRPGHPQTNGMAERFNRRLVDAFAAQPNLKSRGRRKFNNHQDRNAFILRFVANYNHTRQKCLDHKSPIEMINNLTGLYTE